MLHPRTPIAKSKASPRTSDARSKRSPLHQERSVQNDVGVDDDSCVPGAFRIISFEIDDLFEGLFANPRSRLAEPRDPPVTKPAPMVWGILGFARQVDLPFDVMGSVGFRWKDDSEAQGLLRAIGLQRDSLPFLNLSSEEDAKLSTNAAVLK